MTCAKWTESSVMPSISSSSLPRSGGVQLDLDAAVGAAPGARRPRRRRDAAAAAAAARRPRPLRRHRPQGHHAGGRPPHGAGTEYDGLQQF